MSDVEELAKRLRAGDNCWEVTDAAAALEAQAARVNELEALCERLKLEAQIHSGEARTHKSTVHECYQAASGATGEPGNWHGSTPVRDRIASLEQKVEEYNAAVVKRSARIASLESQLKAFREAAERVHKNKVARTTHQTVIATDDYDALMSALRMEEERWRGVRRLRICAKLDGLSRSITIIA